MQAAGHWFWRPAVRGRGGAGPQVPMVPGFPNVLKRPVPVFPACPVFSVMSAHGIGDVEQDIAFPVDRVKTDVIAARGCI